MSEQRPRHEKDEKEDEKRREKQEKNWDEKWRRDPANMASWAGVFIWAGLVLLNNTLNIVRDIETGAVFFTGAGIIILVAALIRLLAPAHRRAAGGGFVVGLIFLGVGLGWLINWGIVGPIILIAIGLVIVFRGMTRRRR